MTRFRGNIGINRGAVETSPGIFEQQIEEVEVTGDIKNPSARWQSMALNDTVSLKHVLSIVTPETALVEYSEVVYVVWQSRKWSVIGIQYMRPRVELAIGGLYNG